jgi:predicted Holliday junction resolvase-like endonuclease
MKKVHTPDNVAHLWANQHQEEARTQTYNLYFNGKSIYSYGSHFCIAKHVEGAVLFTEREYSNTTSKHKSIVRNACSHKNIVYCYNPLGSHEQNFQAWRQECEGYIEKLAKARKPEKYIQELEGVKYRAERYAKLFDIAVPEELTQAWGITSKAEIVSYMEAKAEAIRKRKEAQEKRLKKEHRDNVKKFRDFKTPRVYTRLEYDLLRYNPSNQRFQTSQGVEIPLAIGLGIYKRLVNNQAVEKVLDFEVKEITKKYIQVGCHKVEIKEIAKVVAQAN